MVDNKSLDVPLRIIAALLSDIQMSHGEVFTPRAQRLTIQKIAKRCEREGISFLTKTLPRLGKAFDKALLGESSLNSANLGFKTGTFGQLPKFLGELFQCIFSHDGRLLPEPCVKCITDIRQLLYFFKKYELPNDQETEQKVLEQFLRTEQDLVAVLPSLLRLHKNEVDAGGGSAFRNDTDLPCEGQSASDWNESNCGGCWFYQRSPSQLSLGLDRIPDSKTVCSSRGHFRPPSVGRTYCGREGRNIPPSVSTIRSEQAAMLVSDRNVRGGNTSDLLASRNLRRFRVEQYVELDQLTFQPWNAEWFNGRSLATPTTRLSNVEQVKLVTRARKLLSELFASFDPFDIYPANGPGALSTRETLWDKLRFGRVSPRLATSYPLDAFFFASLGHVCDKMESLQGIRLEESAAKICLVPKDSRGPRIISCEPHDFMWIQQGLREAMYQHIEHHPLTRDSVRFTDQQPNQQGALKGSLTGEFATLDLNEASDRISVELVRLLFPEPLLGVLLNCRSLGTVMPDGQYIKLRKFAPMGSALCFPILALTIWAILTAGAPDADTRKSILVYGDDVVVLRAHALDAIRQLESFGLKINRDKSCYTGFFRESCGVDAYKGHDVTPVKLKTVWTSSRRPDTYAAWISYANSLHSRGYRHCYDEVVTMLTGLYGEIPDQTLPWWVEPKLVSVPEAYRPKRSRAHADYQSRQWHVWIIKSQVIQKEIDGWQMLLRYFSDGKRRSSPSDLNDSPRRSGVDEARLPLAWLRWDDLNSQPYSVRSYTKRDTSILVKRWR